MLVYVNLNQRYPDLIEKHRAGDSVDLRSLAEITLEDWFRLGRDRAERITALAGIFHDRVVTAFPASFGQHGTYDPETQRYSLLPFFGPDPADDLTGLLGQHVAWGRGNPSFKDAAEWPQCESGDAKARMLQLLADYATGTTRPDAPRPQEDDPLLSRITVDRNPRGGVIVSVPTGTNVLIQNTKDL